MARVLVVGGAGYVGSGVASYLIDQGHDVWVLDDLSRGHRELAIGRGFTHAQAGDTETVKALLLKERPDCVMHFAAFAQVGESVHKPEMYFENNVEQTRKLLETMVACGVRTFVFSSTCAIFGNPTTPTLAETHSKHPINPYGETKLRVEEMMEGDFLKKGIHSTALRYFNASGADPKLRVGEWHYPETHLIPIIIQAIENEKPVSIYGTDYPTPDGTCVRDYIHIHDLARAHETAMVRMLAKTDSETGSFEAFNVGSEKGYSVKEIIQTCEKVIGTKVEINVGPRRAGDPPALVANSALAKKELGFRIDYGIEKIIETAWKWEKKKREPKKAVFLDRDGTLNVDPGYLSDPSLVELLPTVKPALKDLKKAGYKLFVVSNQSGVARGLIRYENLQKIHLRLNALLGEESEIDLFRFCLHHPNENCDCRKPSPKIIQQIADEYSIDLSKSFMVGDKLSDIICGANAKVAASVLVLTGEGTSAEGSVKAFSEKAEVHVVNNLLEAANLILNR